MLGAVSICPTSTVARIDFTRKSVDFWYAYNSHVRPPQAVEMLVRALVVLKHPEARYYSTIKLLRIQSVGELS